MLAYIFVLFAVAVRFLPHPWSFTPVLAALLFFGARGERRRLWIPFTLLAVSDAALTLLVYRYPFSWDHFITWAWYAGMLWLGTSLKSNAGPVRILATALCGSVSFFIISNLAVWAAWNSYPHTFAGLMTCYALAVPFFRNALEGDLLFTAAMFATPVALQAVSKWTKPGQHSAAA